MAMDYPKVKEAAVIGLPHSKWDERPLLIVVAKEGQIILKNEFKLSFSY